MIVNEGASSFSLFHLGLALLSTMHSPPPTDLSGKVVDDMILLESCIGRGGFGAVYRAKFLPTSSTVAVKVVPHNRDGRQYWRLKDEIFLHWCMSSDPSVITMRRSIKDKSYTYIIMVCTNG